MIKVKALAQYKAEILIYGPIGEDWLGDGVMAREFREDLEALGEVTDITVRINSPGGVVWDGVAIYNALKEHPAEILVHIDGLAASSASLVAMAGDIITMGTASQLMLHNPWSIAIGDAEDMRKNAEVLDQIRDGMIDAYEAKSSLDREEILAMMAAETWLLVDDAIAKGLADERTGAAADDEGEESDEELARAALLEGWAPVMARFKRTPNNLKVPRNAADQSQSAAAGAQQTSKEGKMDKKSQASAHNADKLTDEQKAEIRAATLAENKARTAGIRQAFAKFGPDHADLMNKCLDDHECSVEDAGQKLLKALAEGREPAGSIQPGEDEHDKRIRGIEGGLLARAPQALNAVKQAATKHPDRKDFKGIDSGGEFRGMSLYDLARDDLERMVPGSTRSKSRRAVVSSFFSAAGSHQTTSDFSVALENTLNKVLLASYMLTDDTWREFCAVGEVSDFRAHSRYRTGFIASLDEVVEEGEFKNKTIPDAVKETIQAATYGNIVGLSRKAIINDDMGVFNRVAFQVGRAAGLTIEELVYALLAENSGLGPAMNDTKTLFHADHDNIGAGAALSAAAIDDDAELLESQTDPSGNEYLGLRPSVLLVPRGLRGTAITINESQFDPDTADSNKPNIVLGLFDKVVATPRLTGTRRYLFADPNAIPALEVAFLNGEQEPYMEMKDGWTTDGVEWKVRHDVGVSAVDYRAAVTDAGA